MSGNFSFWAIRLPLCLLMMVLVTGCSVPPLVVKLDFGIPAPVQAKPAAGTTVGAGITLHKFDDAMRNQLESYIGDALARMNVPGAEMGIIQNGQVVYQQGFGVRDLGGSEPVTPQTLMMIGSTGKSMTTMMMATAVDDGLFTWDTPVVKVLPWFALQDPALTPKVTMRHLVCNCSGIQRHDAEMFFTSKELTPERIIRSLRTFQQQGAFGETFGYVNQLVAAGGYASAAAIGGSSSDLYGEYVAAMQARVFNPIGMSSTTFSFDKVRANANYATPHSATAAMKYISLPLEQEAVFTPFAPAGLSWSNINDLMRYLITQLNQGVAPDGRRVVSVQNLSRTWQPGVKVNETSSYGMGWDISQYNGTRILSHGGGTSGFSSILVILPEANIGVAVLVNAGLSAAATTLPSALAYRALELIFDQPATIDAQLKAAIEVDNQQANEITRHLQPQPDRLALAPYFGVYHNEMLGDITLAMVNDKLTIDAGEFVSELRPIDDSTYILWDPPLASTHLELTHDGADHPQLVFDPHSPYAPTLYPFDKVR